MSAKKSAKPAELQQPDSKPYEPSSHERAVVAAYLAELKERPPAPRMKVADGTDGVNEIGVDHPQPAIGKLLLMEALGTKDEDFYSGLLSQLLNVGTQGKKVEPAPQIWTRR